MAYTLTARQLFDEVLPSKLPQMRELREVGGTVEVTLEGEGGGVWTLDLTAGALASGPASTPDIVLRAQERDFLALVEGRMSVNDGMLTQRLAVAGDGARLSRFFAALETLRGS